MILSCLKLRDRVWGIGLGGGAERELSSGVKGVLSCLKKGETRPFSTERFVAPLQTM